MATDTEMAEKAGFEPAVRYKPYTRFPGVHLRPLGHFSVNIIRPLSLSIQKVAQDKPDPDIRATCTLPHVDTTITRM